MKRFLPFLSLAVLMAACNTNPQLNNPSMGTQTMQQAPGYNPDTVGLAQFRAWKAQNELANVNTYNQPAQQAQASTNTKTVYYVPVQKAPVHRASTSGRSTYNSGNSEPVSMTSESANTAKATVKKGWSKAAKGTAIGAGAGAVLGAVLDKNNRAVGGVIGGVLGGAIGYGVGHGMDKKDGRY